MPRKPGCASTTTRTLSDSSINEPIYEKALHFLEAAGDAAAALYSNPEAFAHYESARGLRFRHDPGIALGDRTLSLLRELRDE